MRPRNLPKILLLPSRFMGDCPMTNVAASLNPKELERIHAMQRRAKAAFDGSDPEEAGRLALEAWAAVPEPRYGWDHSYMFLFFLFRLGRRSSQRKAIIDIVTGYLRSSYYLPVEDGPYFWLGALLFEENQFDAAFENLQRAVQISHSRCFREEDPKYKKFFDERRKQLPARSRHV